MTPLAHRIVKELTLPLKRRTFRDDGNLLAKMGDVHCFDVTEVSEYAVDLGQTFVGQNAVPDNLMFLPAPKTWVEYATRWGRVGYLVEERDDWPVIAANGANDPAGVFGSADPRMGLLIGGRVYAGMPIHADLLPADKALREKINMERAAQANFAGSPDWWHAILAIINSPRAFGRNQHSPHRGLARALFGQQKSIGNFPVHTWTEIRLEVTPPSSDGASSTSEQLTGEKALHFCRKFGRFRLGKWEWVTAHWRGNPAIGMRQGRYKVVPPAEDN